MDNCVLCLEEKTFDNCIKSASRQWSQLNVLNIIEKYFWPIKNLYPECICHDCWQQLYDFHIFHKKIEEAHQLNAKFAKQRLQNKSHHHLVEVYKYDEEFNGTENEMSQKHSIPMLFQIRPNNFLDGVSIKDEFVEEISPNEENERHSYPISIVDNNTVKVENVMKKPKRKRGRPRKIPSISEMLLKQPKGKRGRPRKTIDNNNEIIRKQNNGKRGRPRKKIKIDIDKKGKRGRPRKIELTEHTDSDIDIGEEYVPANLEQPAVQTPIRLLENLPLSEQNTSKALVKETKREGVTYKKYMDKFKKRKNVQQHKALMRNYIATSVRCMSFIKK